MGGMVLENNYLSWVKQNQKKSHKTACLLCFSSLLSCVSGLKRGEMPGC
jgi:hypothetical protein